MDQPHPSYTGAYQNLYHTHTRTHTHTHTHAHLYTYINSSAYIAACMHTPHSLLSSHVFCLLCSTFSYHALHFFCDTFTLTSCTFLLNSFYSMLTGQMRAQRSSDPNKKTCPKLLPNAFANRATVLEVETPHFSFSFDPKMKRSKKTILLTGRRIRQTLKIAYKLTPTLHPL